MLIRSEVRTLLGAMQFFRAFTLSLMVAATAPLTTEARAADTAADLIDRAAGEVESHFRHAEWEGVKNLLGGSKAVLLVPDFTSGSFIVGVEGGSALLLVRHGNAWSDPVFVHVRNTSVGLQAGVKESAVQMLVLTRRATDQLVDGVARVAGTGGFALGTLGVGASGGGGLSGGVELLTVSTSEGLALGTGLARTSVSLRDDLNAEAYGASPNIKTILSEVGGAYEPATALRAALADAVRASWYH